MRSDIRRVIELQSQWTSENTSQMQERGRLIRNAIPIALKGWRDDLSECLGDYGDSFAVEGRDGTGLKAHVPWVRLFSSQKAPSAQQGWYCVYLFHPDGSGVSLCLSHGSTTWDGGSLTVRSDAEANELLAWATASLAAQVATLGGIKRGVELGSKDKLALAYEKTTAYSQFYPADSLPDDTSLQADLKAFLGFLGRLYRAEDLGQSPEAISPEVSALNTLVELAANPLLHGQTQRGQGRGLTAAERKLVELEAMKHAREWLAAHSFKAEDTSLTKPYDFFATKSGVEFVVEVKGSTGGLGDIILTKNEVAAHQFWYPNNILIVVYGMSLSETRSSVSGGTVHAIESWKINDADLVPLSFSYRVA